MAKKIKRPAKFFNWQRIVKELPQDEQKKILASAK
jgi:hypothetical protein